MNKLYIIIFLLVSVIGNCYSQNPEDGSGRVKRMKEAQEFKMKFLAQEMELKEDQKQEFFRLYEEMSKEKRDCYKDAMEAEKELKDNKDATEEDYKKVTEAMNKANTESNEIEQKFDDKFSQFLSQKQIYKMKEAEKEFKCRMENMRQARKSGKAQGHKQKLK